MKLNRKQMDLLSLISAAGRAGAVIYGRGPTETNKALQSRKLVETVVNDGAPGQVWVVVMGCAEQRILFRITAAGCDALDLEYNRGRGETAQEGTK